MRGGGGRGSGRRDEAGAGGREMVNGRPRKTQEELDREMEDYWNKKAEESKGAGNAVVGNGAATSVPVPAEADVIDEDIDMAL